MNDKKKYFATVALVTLAAPTAMAQLEVGGTLLDSCAEIEPLRNAGNFASARDQAERCLEGLEQEVAGEIGRFFREEIGEWRRTSYDQNQVVGFNNISAVYRKGDLSVNVSLLGQAGGRGNAGGLADLFGGIAQQAVRQQGGQEVTVAGLPATIAADGTLTIPLESGSILTFESSRLNSVDDALQGMGDLVNDFPVADINAAL